MAPKDSADGLRVEVLGPVEAWVDDRQVALGGRRPRALLAVLALMQGRPLTSERLIDELWGDEPPARARDSLQVHVSRLRKALTEAGGDADRLVNQAGGYALKLGPGARDVDRWAATVGRARQARSAGRLEAARLGLEEALGVWRGAPLGGAGAHALLDGERARLEEERLAATIERIEIDLELGRHGELLGQLEALVVEHPYSERLVSLQMLALYRCGRQADALAAFRAGRGRFTEDLGIEPGEALRELHDDVLRHAVTLAGETRPAQPGERRLPVPPSRTIGRGDELEALAVRLRAGSGRLLTLTGPGGVGKTRLALEAARAVEADFADGAWWVSLAALHRADDVPAAIVRGLGVIVLSHESPGDAVRRFMAAKHLLLVLDNFEHVLPAAPLLGELLEACPALTILATSREALALHAEECHPVPPLALPAPGAPAADADAVALFHERARAHAPDIQMDDADAMVAGDICRRLDGLPLAIELAAARCGLLSVDEIAERLVSVLGAPTTGPRDAPARQQTLRATIDWSHDLLDDAEKDCFARFAVFAGSATVEAAETITHASLDTLEHLVAKSLLARRQDAHAPSRLRMLETIRAYAVERLVSDVDADAVRGDHYRYYLALAERHGGERALRGADDGRHLARLDAEVDNLHAALGWAIGRADAERALAMVAALGGYWIMRNRYADAVDWIDQALDLQGADAHPALCVLALRTKSKCWWQMGHGGQSAVVDAMEAIARPLGDPLVLSQALQHRVDHEIDRERLDVADAVADEALHWARAAGDEWEIAQASRGKAVASHSLAELRERVEAAARLLADAGNVHVLANLLTSAAYAALCLGSAHDAQDFASRAAPLARAMDVRFEQMINSGNLGLAALLTGHTDAASDAFRDELVLCREMVVPAVVFEGLSGLAAVAVDHCDDQRAATLLGAAHAHRHHRVADPVDLLLDESYFAPARARWGTLAWDAAACDGGTLSFDEAIAYALDASPV